jgi:hypothetical protein
VSRLFTYSIQNVTLHLRVDAPALFLLAACLHSSSCRKASECPADTTAEIIWNTDAKGQCVLILDGQPEADTVTEAALFFLSEHRLTQLFAERLQHLLQLHAATVVDPQGQGWLICGPSRAGKTSVTLAFILSGWHWLSDEYALFAQDAPATVLGFPRNFNLKETSFPIFPETAGQPHAVEFFSTGRQLRVRFLDPLDLAPGSWQPQAPLKGLIFPRWDGTVPTPVIRQISGITAAQVLLGETACWQPWALDNLTRICRELPVLEFIYANPRDIAPLQAAMANCSP